MALKSINRSIHIYQVKTSSPDSLDIDNICESFAEKHLKDNIREVDGENYLMVIFKKDSIFLSGAFIKVKDISPVLIEKSKSILDFFRFKADQDPGEISNFLWDFENDIIVGEFNLAGVRHLSCKLPKYLSKSLNKEIHMSPVPYEDTYKTLFLKNKLIKTMKLRVPRPSANLVQEVYGLDVKDIKKYTDNDDDLEIEVNVTCTANKKGLLKEPMIKVYEKMKKSSDPDIKLTVKDNNGEWVNLLEDVNMRYKIEFNMDDKTKTINRGDFFNKVKRFWIDNKSLILSVLQND